MYLYTLNKKFIPVNAIDDFVSAIWTERYSSAGEVQIVTAANPTSMKKLAKGTFLARKGTKEIMLLDTQSVENNLLTVTGKSITEFLNQREAFFVSEEDGDSYVLDLTTGGEIIADVVEQVAITPPSPSDFDEGRDQIKGLELGKVSDTAPQKRLSVESGPLYDVIQKVARDEGVGFKMYLEMVSSTDYVLKFTTWLGKDRTSGQTDNLMVRLSPELDSLADTKEVTSIAEYKNVIYVTYDGFTSIHYAEPSLPAPEQFDRRVVRVDAPSIYIAPAKRAAFRAQVAKNTMAENLYVTAVDGEVSTALNYKYGRDFYLGDIIELEGASGLISKARVTEYIWSQDEYGDKEYPTLAVVDPLFTGYMPDVEPDPNEDPELDEDPVYDPDLGDLEPPERDPDPNPDPEPIIDPIDPNKGNGGPVPVEPTPGDPDIYDGDIYDPSPEGSTDHIITVDWETSNFELHSPVEEYLHWNGFEEGPLVHIVIPGVVDFVGWIGGRDPAHVGVPIGPYLTKEPDISMWHFVVPYDRGDLPLDPLAPSTITVTFSATGPAPGGYFYGGDYVKATGSWTLVVSNVVVQQKWINPSD